MDHINSRLAAALLLVIMLIPAAAAVADDSTDVFWRYAKDRYNRPTLTDPIVVPAGIDPYEYLAGAMGYEDWMVRNAGNSTILAEKAVDGEVPVLCLHKISREEDYALSPERFRRLLRYLNDNDWYMVSDYQYIQGDFSRVPTGCKPIVMGSDDGSHGNMIYQTRGDRMNGTVKRFFGTPIMERDSMAAILEKYAPREDGRINFTFYVSFDGIPFRQLDGAENPGFPYEGIPIVYEKVKYLDENFILGIHTLSHTYAHDISPAEFAREVEGCWSLLDEYAGGRAESVRTLAFPYGIRPLTPELRRAVTSIDHNGERLAGAFDFDNKLAPPPGNPGDSFDISRFNVDNKNWDRLLRTLDGADAVSARREIIWETDTKRLPRSRYSLGAASSDDVWVLVRGEGEDAVASGSGGESAAEPAG